MSSRTTNIDIDLQDCRYLDWLGKFVSFAFVTLFLKLLTII